MKAEYKRDLQSNYLILEVSDVDTEDSYGLRMAEQNQVKGLLPIHESRQDGKLYLHYEITSKQTLENMYEKKVMGYQDILYVLAGIRDTLEDMRKYLLSPKKLLFAPELMYVLPEKGGLMLCYYAKEDEYPITVLAEFILKKLDHKDRQAVTLGYGFFQQASSANFSLPKALSDILSVSGEAGRVAEARSAGHESIAGGASRAWPAGTEEAGSSGAVWTTSERSGDNGKISAASVPRVKENRTSAETSSVWQTAHEDETETYSAWTEANSGVSGRTGKGRFTCTQEVRNAADEGETVRKSGQESWFYEEENPPVIHRERNRKTKKSPVDLVFSKMHPAILLTFLLFMIVLELLIAFEVLGLTEAGGCFFLILSAEILVNRKIMQKKKTTEEEWQEDEENEEYQRILQEMYEDETESEAEPIEETCCLTPGEKKQRFLLSYVSDDSTDETYPDIALGKEALYIGKIPGEADVLLHSATVSRMHARLTMHEGKCCLKDMNSKNGCFVNGRRLLPHEECELQEGDRVAFAEIEYRVVKQ